MWVNEGILMLDIFYHRNVDQTITTYQASFKFGSKYSSLKTMAAKTFKAEFLPIVTG